LIHVVMLSMAVRGTVESFDAAAFQLSMALLLNVADSSLVSVLVRSGSVTLDVSIEYGSSTAAQNAAQQISTASVPVLSNALGVSIEEVSQPSVVARRASQPSPPPPSLALLPVAQGDALTDSASVGWVSAPSSISAPPSMPIAMSSALLRRADGVSFAAMAVASGAAILGILACSLCATGRGCVTLDWKCKRIEFHGFRSLLRPMAQRRLTTHRNAKAPATVGVVSARLGRSSSGLSVWDV
jgi:hypothetical protein